MAFAKATQDVEFEAKSVTIKYLMDDKLKGYFEKELPLVLNKNGIIQGEGIEVILVPIRMGRYVDIMTSKKILPEGKSKREIDAFFLKNNDTFSSKDASNLVENFVHGFSAIGSQGTAVNMNDAMKNSIANGLYTLGVGLVFNGINALSTMSDQYLMVTDVYFGEQRTRIFSFVFSASVSEKEAYESLTRLTSKKIAELASGKGAKRCDLD
jgi:hypothetical protein